MPNSLEDGLQTGSLVLEPTAATIEQAPSKGRGNAGMKVAHVAKLKVTANRKKKAAKSKTNAVICI